MGECRRVPSWSVFVLSGIIFLATGGTPATRASDVVKAPAPPQFYRPKLRFPAAFEPILKNIAPGGDAFPEEKVAAELAARLSALSAALRESPGRARAVGDLLLGPSFKGAQLTPAAEETVNAGP